MKKKLSPHFWLHEFLATAHTELANVPNAAIIGNLEALCVNVLEPMRAALGGPVVITSGYRSPALNAAVGGVPNSQHQLGEAADLYIPGVELDDIIDWLVRDGKFDQAYKGPTFVHVSYRRGCRGQVIRR